MSGAVTLLLSAIFSLAAVSKIRDREAFALVLRKLLPSSLINPVALAIPAIEVFLSVWLLSGIATRTALAAAIALLIGFTLVLVQMWRRGLKGCGCFGETEDTAEPGSGVARNLLLIGGACFIISNSNPHPGLGPDTSSFLGQLTLVVGAFCLWPCLVALVQRRKFLIS